MTQKAITSSVELPEQPCSDPPTFIDLPVEIRLKIYEFVFGDIKIFGFSHVFRSKVIYELSPKHPLALLTVSKQVKEEAQQNASRCPIRVMLTEGCKNLGRHFPQHLLDQVTLVSFADHQQRLQAYLGRLDVQRYPNLRRVEFRTSFGTISRNHLLLNTEHRQEFIRSGQIPPASSFNDRLHWIYREKNDMIKDYLFTRGMTVRVAFVILLSVMGDIEFLQRIPERHYLGHTVEVALVVTDWSKDGVKIVSVERTIPDHPKRKREADDDESMSKRARRKPDGID